MAVPSAAQPMAASTTTLIIILLTTAITATVAAAKSLPQRTNGVPPIEDYLALLWLLSAYILVIATLIIADPDWPTLSAAVNAYRRPLLATAAVTIAAADHVARRLRSGALSSTTQQNYTVC